MAKKGVNTNFPNYTKYRPAYGIVVPAERGDNRAARRRDEAFGRKVIKTPYFLSKEHLIRKQARANLVAFKLKYTKKARRAMAHFNWLKERKKSLSFTK